jgi:hypothetical protein
VSGLRQPVAAAFALAFAAFGLGCSRAGHGEGLDVARLPPDVRQDYSVFAQRCSKCHSLSRPLESGITQDAYWAAYVARMRRQPGSGISLADEVPILRFLHYYSSEQARRDDKPEAGP